MGGVADSPVRNIPLKQDRWDIASVPSSPPDPHEFDDDFDDDIDIIYIPRSPSKNQQQRKHVHQDGSSSNNPTNWTPIGLESPPTPRSRRLDPQEKTPRRGSHSSHQRQQDANKKNNKKRRTLCNHIDHCLAAMDVHLQYYDPSDQKAIQDFRDSLHILQRLPFANQIPEEIHDQISQRLHVDLHRSITNIYDEYFSLARLTLLAQQHHQLHRRKQHQQQQKKSRQQQQEGRGKNIPKDVASAPVTPTTPNQVVADSALISLLSVDGRIDQTILVRTPRSGVHNAMVPEVKEDDKVVEQDVPPPPPPPPPPLLVQQENSNSRSSTSTRSFALADDHSLHFTPKITNMSQKKMMNWKGKLAPLSKVLTSVDLSDHGGGGSSSHPHFMNDNSARPPLDAVSEECDEDVTTPSTKSKEGAVDEANANGKNNNSNIESVSLGTKNRASHVRPVENMSVVQNDSNDLTDGGDNTTIATKASSTSKSVTKPPMKNRRHSTGSSMEHWVVDSLATTIHSKAFFCCRTLQTIQIPPSVTKIGKSAFSSCTHLMTVNLAQVDGQLKRIGESAFASCTSLTRIDIPASVKELDDSAFWNCTSLTKVNFTSSASPPEAADKKGSKKHSASSSLLRRIGESCFSGCTALHTITLPPSVKEIGGYAFRKCGSLTSVHLSSGLVRIGPSAFAGCHSLKSITIPPSVHEIGKKAFASCHAMTTVAIATKGGSDETISSDGGCSLKKIGDEAFVYCRSLKWIEIPASVEKIGKCTFWECASLTTVHLSNGLQRISEYAFAGATALETMTIPSSVVEIGLCAFSSCATLTTVNLTPQDETKQTPNGLQQIGANAFYNCGSLSSITIPSSVEEIGESAFSHCLSLTWANLSNCQQLACIPKYAFRACKVLESITIPPSVKEIGDGAFHRCEALAKVTLPDGVGIAPTNTAENATTGGDVGRITSGQLKRIGEAAFADCRSLTSIHVPSSVEEIGIDAFSDCSSLIDVRLPKYGNLAKIGEECFSYCHALTVIEIPSSVKEIGSDAFSPNVSVVRLMESSASTLPIDLASDL